MNQRDYLAEKERKIKSTKQGLAVMSIFIVIFMTMIFRFAVRNGSDQNKSSSTSIETDAYNASRDYLKATMMFPDAEFSDDDFQCTTKPGSVYVVKSYFEVRKNGETVKTNFIATLQYKGGLSSDDHNWTMVSLSEK